MVAAYKRGKNLEDFLVHSKMGPITGISPSKTQATFVRGRKRTVHRFTQAIPLNQKNCVCEICGGN